MKNKIVTITMILIATILLVSCTAVQKKVSLPTVEKVLPKTYELRGLYLTTDPKQMSGVPRDTVKLGVGESVVIYARGMNEKGEWFELPSDVIINWKADKELEVTPIVGHVVTIKVVKPIEVASYVTATTTTKDGKEIKAILAVRSK